MKSRSRIVVAIFSCVLSIGLILIWRLRPHDQKPDSSQSAEPPAAAESPAPSSATVFNSDDLDADFAEELAKLFDEPPLYESERTIHAIFESGQSVLCDVTTTKSGGLGLTYLTVTSVPIEGEEGQGIQVETHTTGFEANGDIVDGRSMKLLYRDHQNGGMMFEGPGMKYSFFFEGFHLDDGAIEGEVTFEGSPVP